MGFKKIYSCKEDYFKTINTDAKAYLLGFLMADGSVSKKGRIKLHLKAADIEVVAFFAKELESTYRIIIGKAGVTIHGVKKYYPTVCTTIYSKKMVEDLAKYGVVPNKTYAPTAVIPNIPEELIPAYVRGFFDGDGSLRKKHGIISGINFVGLEPAMRAIYELLVSWGVKATLGFTKEGKNNCCYVYVYNMADNLAILDKLYAGSTFHLARKYARYEQLQKQYADYLDRHHGKIRKISKRKNMDQVGN